MAATDTTTSDGAKVVEGSDGLLLEVDGRIVPNYDATISPFEEGDVVTGNVVRIDNDEVLVDIGYKSEGVIPSSELSIRKSVDPSEEVSLGEEVDALVLTQEDPWQRVVDTYNVGDELEGTVTKVVTFGAFVEILDGVEGLVHISELAQHHIENPREIVEQGDQVKVRILEIDSERRRL